uniref:TIL domain containing protein n=1 Tax=Rhipicephalus appendiculatus TaxID=34631 RepID=A0A131Z1X6_RHIAP
MSRNMTIVLLVLVVCATLVHVHGQFDIWPARLINGYSELSPQRRCSPGEVYQTCQSSSCGENHCNHLTLPGLVSCKLDCVTGCFCAKPLYRNKAGQCVHVLNCPAFRKNRP